jgi:hypothetical protein
VYKRLFFLVSLVLVLGVAGNASAAEIYWTNGSYADSLWSTQLNWSAGVPTSADTVYMNDGVGPTINSSTTGKADRIYGPGNGGVGSMTMTIDGGTLNVTGPWWSIAHGGSSGGGIGTVNVINNATVNNNADLYVGNYGNGTLNIGTLGGGDNSTVTTNMLLISMKEVSNYGHVYLYSGLLDTVDLTGYYTGNDILIDISGGTLIVRAKTGAPIQHWIDQDYIIAYGGTGTVILETTPEGWDKLTAVMGETIIVDDFDSYADSADLRNTWVENKAGVYYEGVRTYGTAQDWTAQNIEVLDVWFRGKSTNDAEQMYVTLSDGTHFAAVIYDDPNAVKSETWQPWHIELQDFTDVNLAGVEQISIGIGDGSSPAGSGEVYFDDITLFQSRCFDKPAWEEGNLNNDCVIDFKDTVILAGNWLKEGMWP